MKERVKMNPEFQIDSSHLLLIGAGPEYRFVGAETPGAADAEAA
jgi:hypothetical protein